MISVDEELRAIEAELAQLHREGGTPTEWTAVRKYEARTRPPQVPKDVGG